MSLGAPLRFAPVYQSVVWGGERIAALRSGVPTGPVGEAWDLADHSRGMSVVAHGPLAGRSLRELARDHGAALLGRELDGATFPLMVKLIDARDRLSVQVHPDDALAREMGLADGGKTECWYVVADGTLYVGTEPGVDAAAFEAARVEGRMESALARHSVRRGDFVYLPARTVHAIGAGCLLLEVQQTSDNTFRVDDWGRLGLDGKPRPLHVEASRRAIDFSLRPTVVALDAEGRPRGRLVDGPFFTLDEVTADGAQRETRRCVAVTALGAAEVWTPAGTLALGALETALVPADAGLYAVRGEPGALVLLSEPC